MTVVNTILLFMNKKLTNFPMEAMWGKVTECD